MFLDSVGFHVPIKDLGACLLNFVITCTHTYSHTYAHSYT